MIGGIVRKPALHCLLVNAILIAGSPGIYASDLSRSRRDASCPSCSRDSPAALANWDSPSPRVPRPSDAEFTSWYSGKGQSQQSQYRTNPFSVDPLNPYYGAARGRGSAEVSRAWSAGGREGSNTLRFGDVYPDLAPAPASPFYNIKTPNSPTVPLSPLGPVSKVPSQPLSPNSALVLPPNRPFYNPQFQPFGPVSNPPFQPLSPVSNPPFQPLGPVSNPPFQPLGPASNPPFQPFAPDSNPPFEPYGPASNPPFQPFAPIISPSFQPFGPASNGPFRPNGPVSRVPFRNLDSYDLADPKVTSVNPGYLNYELPVPPKSIFEDPDTRASVVYRADKYNDDSDEDDPAPLYPSDYPRKQFDSRTDVFEVGRPGIQVDKTVLFPPPPKMYGWIRTNNGGNYRLNRSKESRVTGATSETQRDQLLGASLSQRLGESQEDQSRDVRVGQPQIEQIQDPGMAQRLSNFPENQFRESRMAQNYQNVQGNQPRDSKTADRFGQHQDAQPEDFKMADRIVYGDQSRNSRMADKLIQPQEKQFRSSSVMQVPETGFAPRDQLSQQDIMKIMQQVGTVVANRSNAEEQKRGQQDVQVASDYANKSLDSPRKEEAKEKRGTVDEEKVPANANDDYSLPQEMTTQAVA